MNKEERHKFLESLSDFTLYETFYEAGTMLGEHWLPWKEKLPSDRTVRCSAVSARNVSTWVTTATTRRKQTANAKSGS